MNRERIRALEAEIADLERRLPAHSTPPSLLARLEELEDELARARAKGENDSSANEHIEA